MAEIKSRWKSVTNGNSWAARGASLLAKVKATKLVWFPPKPEQAGKTTASTARQATEDTTEKTTASANKTAASIKNVTNPATPN
jgi:hypothetical protein